MKLTEYKNLPSSELVKIKDVCIGILANRDLVRDILENNDLTIEDVIGYSITSKRKSSGKVATKFVHKHDSTLTWSGRGRTPKWVKKFGKKV